MKKMKYVVYLFLIVLLFSGCATIQPKFEDSNQLFIEKTVDNIDLGNTMKSKIPSGSKVALVSLEKDVTLDKPIIALIEDQLIQSLVNSGFKVLERDKNAIENLIKESNSSNNYSMIQNNSELLNSKNVDIEISDLTFSPINLKQTEIEAADYLINYRILECGIIYRDFDTEKDIREGLVRLHIRVQKTNNGEILSAQNLDGKNEDKIEKELVPQLADFHYSYFPYDYPLQPKQRKEEIIKPKKATSSNGYFYFAPNAGLGFGYREGFAFGGTIGWGSNTFGRIGANFLGVIDNETYNITLQYEKPISAGSMLNITPKFGLGSISDSYRKYDDGWNNYSYRRDVAGFGLVFGGALEFNIAKPFIIKIGYDWFLGLGEEESTNGALITTFGFKI
ncbi:MAG: hypothetical protein U9P79_07040 [Candidatus Cloacimonadota bacterium]|nr:hypothetical protein [Candidatus Cloacimonadota bacterium]